jgi:deoxyadenosine/deoxycytidine kinase
MLESAKRHLIIEGNIGAGKSTFLKIVNSYLDIDPVAEPVEKWQKVGEYNLLDKFYSDTKRWAYTFQTYAFVTRVLEQEEYAKKAVSDTLVIERSVYSDRYCFAKNCYEMGVMTDLEWSLYKEWFSWLVDNYTIKPHGFIYLQTNPDICLNRLKIRHRQEESPVGLDYLKKLHDKHESWLLSKMNVASYIQDVPVLVLDCNKDFESDLDEQLKHIKSIAEFFNLDYKNNSFLNRNLSSHITK